MTSDVAIIFTVFGIMSLLFIHGRVRYDLTALVGLITLIFLQLLKPEDAFAGFSSPTIIIMVSTFFVSEAFFDTGVADKIGRRILKLCGNQEKKTIFAIMLVAGAISTVISNVATTIIMMPVAAYLARRGGFSPSRLFMPIAIAALLGGTVTLLGSSTNVIASDMLSAGKFQGFSLFAYTPIGICILIIGTLFVVFTSNYLLPLRMLGNSSKSGSITDVYGLKERLFSIKIGKGSQLSGKSLASLQLGSVLSIAVVAIIRNGQRKHIPGGSEIIHENDLLVVRGKISHLKRLLRLAQVSLKKLDSAQVGVINSHWIPMKVELNRKSLWCGKRVDSIPFTELGLSVVALTHREKISAFDVNRHYLEAGDSIYIYTKNETKRLKYLCQEYLVTAIPLDSFDEINQFLYTFSISDLKEEGNIDENNLDFLSVSLSQPVFIFRTDGTAVIPTKSHEYDPSDVVLISCELERIKLIPGQKELEIVNDVPNILIDDETTGLLEVALTPRSVLVGQNLTEVQFREKYGLQVLAIWREGKPIRTGFSEISLRIGDALLLFGPPRQFYSIAKDPDFVVLSELDRFPRRTDRSLNLLSSVFLFSIILILDLAPIHVAALTTALFLVITRTVSLEQVYRNIDLRIVVLVASLLPMGLAFEQSGGAAFVTEKLLSIIGHQSPYVILVGFILLASAISQLLDASLSVVLLSPIAIKTALLVEISPYPLVMGIAMGASIAFMTPFSHRANLLVMGAGGYKKSDYFKIGAPLSLILYILATITIPLFIPF